MKNILKIIFYVFLLSPFFSFSQNKSGIAYYNSYHKMNDGKTELLSLKFQDGISLFTIKHRDSLKRVSQNEFQDEITIRRKYPDSLQPKYYTNTITKKIVSIIPLTNDDYKSFEENIILEDSNLKWIILNDIKLIGNQNCQKATLNFRGREYIAWFSKTIKVPFGPFKFNGLPGLIIKITDSKNEINFILNKIEFNNINMDIDYTKVKNNKAIILLSEFVKKQNIARKESQDNFYKRLTSKLGRGSTVSIIRTGNLGIELNYNDIEK